VISVLNTCRADLYRLFRGKTLYISFILFMLLVVLQVLSGENMTGFSVSVNNVTAPPQTEVPAMALTASSVPFLVMRQFSGLVLIALPLIYTVSATEFNSGAIQNALASGLSRPGIYFSKLFLSFALIEVFYIVALVVGIVIGILMGGVGEVSEELVFSFLRAFGTQSLMALTVASVGTAIIFITRKGAALNGVYLLLFLGGAIVLTSVSITTGVDYLSYDFLTNTGLAATFDQLNSEQVIKMFTTIAVYLALSTVLGLAFFRRVAIK
jgi:ABC-type transport system involved in multi-copper enzyme maturation permease subunit